MIALYLTASIAVLLAISYLVWTWIGITAGLDEREEFTGGEHE